MKDNSKLWIGIAIGAAAGITLGFLCNSSEGKKVISEIKDAAKKADKEIKKAINLFEEKLNKSKEFDSSLEKKASQAVK